VPLRSFGRGRASVGTYPLARFAQDDKREWDGALSTSLVLNQSLIRISLLAINPKDS